MDPVLLVSASIQGLDFLSGLLKQNGRSSITTATNGAQARRLFSENDYAVIIINAPLSDEFGHELALLAAENSTAGVLLIVKNEMADEVSHKVEDDGVLVVGKPLNRAIFYQALKLTAATHRRVFSLQSENIRLQNKIEEIRLVDRAKCVLIQYLKLTEAEAHRYIEKQAMDLRVTRREIAQNVLKTYES